MVNLPYFCPICAAVRTSPGPCSECPPFLLRERVQRLTAERDALRTALRALIEALRPHVLGCGCDSPPCLAWQQAFAALGEEDAR